MRLVLAADVPLEAVKVHDRHPLVSEVEPFTVRQVDSLQQVESGKGSCLLRCVVCGAHLDPPEVLKHLAPRCLKSHPMERPAL